MEKIIDYVLDNQEEISNNKFINIKFGFLNLGDKIIDTRIKKENIHKLFNKLKESNLTIKSNLLKYRIYRYLNLEYHIFNDYHKCVINNLENIQIIRDNNLSYIVNINKNLENDVSGFPSQKEYNEIINRNEINLFIDQIFRLTAYIDQSSDNEYIHLTFSVIRQNIFKEKISKSLNKILGLIIDSLKENTELLEN